MTEARLAVPCVCCQSSVGGGHELWVLRQFYISGRHQELGICEDCLSVLGISMQEALDEAAHAIELHFRGRLAAERAKSVLP